MYRNKVFSLPFLKIMYVILILVMFLLPFLHPNMNIIEHTTSQLGAQMTPFAWVMNLTFIMLGIAVIIETSKNFRNFPFQFVLLFIFSILLIGVAFFRHAPLNNENYRLIEDQVHSFIATSLGFIYTIFCFSMIFIVKAFKYKRLALSVALTVSLLSLFFFYFPDYSGLIQRTIFILSFGVLIIFMHQISKNELTKEVI